MKIKMRTEMNRGRKKIADQSGQSTVEFALTLILLLSFVFFYLQLGLVFAYGNYAHYATFMAARAYLSGGPTREDQIGRAKDVAIRMLKKSAGESGADRFPSIAKGIGGNADLGGLSIRDDRFNPTDRTLSWLEGVRYTFRSRLFLIPLAGSGGAGSKLNSITLTSESWLGREPAEDECELEMKNHRGVYDNGC